MAAYQVRAMGDEPLKPLVVVDESTAGPFVTGGAVRIPDHQIEQVIEAIRSEKSRRGAPENARIHCRTLFAGDARRKSPYRSMTSDDVHDLLADCVCRALAQGATWWGSWVDRERYPSQLQLVDGKPFTVSAKHLAGLVCCGALVCIEHHVGPEYRMAYDADRTKIDWGLANRMQATHFARTHSNVTELPNDRRALLELADVAAYTIAQSLLADLRPDNRKAQRFPPLLRLMAMRTSRFAYTPGGQKWQQQFVKD